MAFVPDLQRALPSSPSCRCETVQTTGWI